MADINRPSDQQLIVRDAHEQYQIQQLKQLDHFHACDTSALCAILIAPTARCDDEPNDGDDQRRCSDNTADAQVLASPLTPPLADATTAVAHSLEPLLESTARAPIREAPAFTEEALAAMDVPSAFQAANAFVDSIFQKHEAFHRRQREALLLHQQDEKIAIAKTMQIVAVINAMIEKQHVPTLCPSPEPATTFHKAPPADMDEILLRAHLDDMKQQEVERKVGNVPTPVLDVPQPPACAPASAANELAGAAACRAGQDISSHHHANVLLVPATTAARLADTAADDGSEAQTVVAPEVGAVISLSVQPQVAPPAAAAPAVRAAVPAAGAAAARAVPAFIVPQGLLSALSSSIYLTRPMRDFVANLQECPNAVRTLLRSSTKNYVHVGTRRVMLAALERTANSLGQTIREQPVLRW
jgi:hypothetical protein